MTMLWQDVRYGLRILARSPGFTMFVVVILALGIGTTTAMLSVIDAVMLRSRAPYEDPETLVCVYETDSYVHPVTHVTGRYMTNPTSRTSFQDWRERSHVFTSLVGAHQSDDSVVPHAGRKEKTRALYVSPEFFSTLGATPILGRTFAPEEERPGGERVAILSYTHWQHWFGGDPNVIGKTLTVNQEACTVVGVLPAGFSWIFQRVACGLWMPMALHPDRSTDRNYRGLVAIGRLKPGVDRSQAQAEMDVIAAQLAQEYPDTMRDRGINVVPIDDEVRATALHMGKPRILALMLGIVASVLLIASLHVASLLIARSAVREKEIVVRAALGARRLRLVRQLFTESVLLAGLGGLSGAILTYWILGSLAALRGQAIPWYLPGSDRVIPWFLDVRMDARSLGCVVVVSLLTCVVFGLLPALGVSRTRLNTALSEGRVRNRLPRFHRLRAGLVALDIAMAFVLLTGAGLMVNSFTRLLTTDLQVNAKNVLVAEIDLYDAGDRYSQPQQRIAYSRQIMEGIRRLPGVQSVAVANGTPAWAGVQSGRFTIEGLPAGEDQVEGRYTPVSRDYFRLLQIPLLKGRHFTEHDEAGSVPVAIVSESLARRCWPNQNPLGRHLARGWSERVTREVVGVVKDVRHLGDYPDAEVYVPDLQDGGLLCPSVIVRTDARTADLAVAMRREILAIDPEVPVSNVSSLQELVMDSFSKEQSNTMLLLIGFAGVAVLLAGIGVYGTVAYTVSQRTHEIGIRMALGAHKGDVVKTVLRQGLGFTAMGLAVGLAGALAATRVVRSLLYDVSPTDPLTFLCVALLLAGVALLASYVPARRAARIDPMVALRCE